MTKTVQYHAMLIGALTLISGANLGNALGQDPAGLCDQAARQAASETAVPVEVLLAITRVETGRGSKGQLLPWPWVINLAGEGYWFSDASEAISFADNQLALGQENFDVGCFQINLRWHGAEFSSLDAVFDPQANASYAAQFLTELYTDEGGWAGAVAAYHSRTPEKAEAYLQKVETVLADLDAGNSFVAEYLPIEVAVNERENRFPLLQEGAASSGASLVPILQGAEPLFGGQ